MQSNDLSLSVVAGLVAFGLVAESGVTQAAAEKEKCFGVAKAGQNDCGGKYSKHSCAGQSKADHDPNEFKFVAAGSCEKVGGHLKAAEASKK